MNLEKIKWIEEEDENRYGREIKKGECLYSLTNLIFVMYVCK